MMDRFRMEDRLRNSLEDRVGKDGLVSDDRDGGHRPELGGQLKGRGLWPDQTRWEGWLRVVTAVIATIVTVIAAIAEYPG